MSENHQVYRLTLEPGNTQRLANLCGLLNEHLQLIEQRLAITIQHRGNIFKLSGYDKTVKAGSELLKHLYRETASETITPDMVHLFLQESTIEKLMHASEQEQQEEEIHIKTPRLLVKPRGDNQLCYTDAILHHDINFAIGPAGTGKTFLAVACAVNALTNDNVSRLLLVRPAVEAGEKLGFLPGDLAQKIDPYLRPLYDALYEMLGFEKVNKLIERNVIEVAPLAYMRGRTLNNSYIILDESQNTTVAQMKMFLTRIGFGSTAVITGDITQVDLPRGTKSGLIHVIDVLNNVKGINFTHFKPQDVVRHPLVQRVVEAYESFEQKHNQGISQ